MTIWIDADNFQKDARSLVIRRSLALGLKVFCVSNREINTADPTFQFWVRVGIEDQAADRYIWDNSVAGDMACSRDLDLVGLLLEKGLSVINDKGFRFTPENIGQRQKEALANRLFIEQGVYRPARDKEDKKIFKAFADCLDRILAGRK